MNHNSAEGVGKRKVEDSIDCSQEVKSMDLYNCHNFQHFQTVHCLNNHMTAYRTVADRCNHKFDFESSHCDEIILKIFDFIFF